MIIKIASIIAVSGLLTVLATVVLNMLDMLTNGEKNLAFVVGFAAMLLGTLWKVVLEMNQSD